MVLSQKEADVQMMLAADVHLGTKNCDFQMERYVWKRRSDGYAYTSPFSSSLSLFLVSQR
jgi:ribosomal protein S2